MPRVTIFGMHYAPEPSGNAPYTTSLAEHLVAGGWEVVVHTGVPHYPEWKKSSAPWESVVNGVTVLRHDHYVPETPTVRGRALMDASWLASTSPLMATKLDTDVILGIVPNLSGAVAAAGAAKRSDVPLVLWFQDLMGLAAEQSGVGGAGRVARFVRSAELRAASRASAVLVCAEGFRPHLERGGVDPERIHLMRNWSLLPEPILERDAARKSFGFDDDLTVALHSGNMGAKQGLEVILDAAELSPHITYVLQGHGSHRHRLEHDARVRSLTNVEFLPPLPADDLANLLEAADALLLTQRDSVTTMSLPSKLTAYAMSGAPIVASVHPDSEAAAVLRDLAAGPIVPPEDPQALAEAIVVTVRTAEPVRRRHGITPFGSPGAIETVLASVAGSGDR